MAVQKNKTITKSKKKIVKKQIIHKVVEKKAEDVNKAQVAESVEVVPKVQQVTDPENLATPSVISTGVLADTPKEETLQPQTVESSQTLQQSSDTLTPKPASVIDTPSAEVNVNKAEPIGIVTQNPLADDDSKSVLPEQGPIEEPKKKRSWIIIGIIIVVIIFIVGTLWYFRENATKQIPIEIKTRLTPSPSRVSPTPASESAKLVIDYSKYKIKVLNGSGIRGAAAKGKAILEEEKFIVVEIGNAETSDYDLTIVQAKKEVPSEFLNKLKSELEKTYQVAPIEELEDIEEIDVEIIIGSSKK